LDNSGIVYVDHQGDITVPQGTSLTIVPARFSAGFGGQNLIVNGTLTTQGTTDQPVIFTSRFG